MTDPAALTDDHSPDHWTHAGRRWAAIQGDCERIGDNGIRQALAQLEQHLADGCPQDHHRHIGDGMCRHVVREQAPASISGAQTSAPHPDGGPTSPTATAARGEVRRICGQPLPCPDHPQAVLTGVEAEAARRAQTVHLGDRLTREADAAAIAIGRLLSTVLQVHKLRAAPVIKPDECCGGWGDTRDTECRAIPAHYVWRGGVQYASCSRCYQRCSKSDRRAS